MRSFTQIGDAYIATAEIESISNISVHARTLGKRLVMIRTKSGMQFTGELTVEEINKLLEFVTGSAWNVQ